MFNSLSNVLDQRTIVKHQDNVLTFEETETDARLKKVNFSLSTFNRGPSGLMKNAVVIFGDNKDDELLSRFTFFLNTQCPDVSRQCDYIVFHCHNGKTRVILCELKSSDTSQDLLARIHKQFSFSKIFANYLVEIAKEHGVASSDELEHCDIEFHKVAFVYMPNVTASIPLGRPPVPNITISESNGIKSIFVQTDSQGCSKISWRDFMESV
ncbi:hypothetical protein GA076_18990 [Vibrio parahaemolyticus]|nr:hypothetical protein [Vibrio parahaemolyticus]EGR1958240.1 hypothetical protein [Vibrio parahaemolyticus]EGR1967013.1 hypothetical protein [Vibrio parahaemolyticus]EGU9030349.1 hypothetical protein [Vibrio parahaemolyticus]EHR6710836.1 hypothetical protein [Vibrio parahaemolyticus]